MDVCGWGRVVLVCFHVILLTIEDGHLCKNVILWMKMRKATAPKEQLHLLSDLMEDANSLIFRNLMDAMSNRPKTLVWELNGYFRLSPDFCLSVFNLLKNERDQSTRLVVKVNCSLVNAALLFVVAAEEIQFCPGRCFRLQSLDRFKAMVNRSKGNEFFQGEQEECAAEFEYRECLRILDEYIPVNLLSDKLVPMETLREFNLGMNQEEEKAFARLFESESATV
jgi:hypothetical protein